MVFYCKILWLAGYFFVVIYYIRTYITVTVTVTVFYLDSI